MMTTTQERRAMPRVPVKFPIYYFYFAPSVERPVFHVLNLSENGALIEALDPLEPGTTVAFQMITSDRQVVDVRSQVVRRDAPINAKYHVGVRFTHLPDTDRAILEGELKRATA